MLYIDFEANTEKEATQLALESLGLSMDEVKIEPINSVKKGFFGLGKKEKAKIRVYYKEKSEINDIINTIKTLVTKIDRNCLIEVGSSSDNRYTIMVEASDPGRLIGKNGRSLQALQNIVNAILQKHQNNYKIIIDVDNYNQRLQRNIIFQAKQAAKTVMKTKKPVTLDPLNPFQRRLIHIELKNISGITTNSLGDGKYKSIRIELENEDQVVS